METTEKATFGKGLTEEETAGISSLLARVTAERNARRERMIVAILNIRYRPEAEYRHLQEKLTSLSYSKIERLFANTVSVWHGHD